MAIELKPSNGTVTPPLDLLAAVADRKERPKPWVDAETFPWRDEDFSARFVRRANYQELYGMKETGEEVDDLAALLAAPAKGRVLDLCSGNGRHAIAMALRGFRVTGIDVGPGAVQLARETAKNLGLAVDFRLLDVKSVSFEDVYDAAYLTCGGISDFSPADASAVLSIAARALVPGGRLVVEFADASCVDERDARSWQFVHAERSLFFEGPHLQLEERTFDADSDAEVVRYFVLPSDGHVREFARCRQYHSEAAMREMIKAASLDPVAAAPGSAAGLRKIAAQKS